MSDLEMNLSVMTEYLGELAAKQQTAVDIITTANSHVADIASKIENTHGQVCFATVHALSGNEPRKAAGQALATVSAELNEKLGRASNNYNDADYRAGISIGEGGSECKT
ncbi:ESX-1 secretion-associated protein [Mycolicibacterium septicum]|uniref:ESX-1 secretion-associated protein n=1 Tax=Mycolicibacterium septicum TaxID=98668 RepID=A0ABW9LQG0_9MYCO